MPPTVTALLAGALVFDAFCLVSLVRNEASNLPKWVWAAIICVSCPLGGLAHLAWGRSPADIQPPSGAGVAHVTPIRPALQPPTAITVFMTLYPGVSALRNRPVPRAWSWPWRHQLCQQDNAGNGAF